EIGRVGMKKMILLVVILSGMVAMAWANAAQAASVAGMLKGGLFKNEPAITSASLELSPEERTQLYAKYKKDPNLQFAFNLLLGFGAGSFIGGDVIGGAIAFGGDIVGIAAFFLALDSGSKPLGILSAVTLGGIRIFELIRPYTWSARYNATLRRALQVQTGLYLRPAPDMGRAALDIGYSLALH
ncbi:MAG: P13 family porin, partial [Spirochaetales bacterium]|nr:P13 family porin [Spirochaetales bacterium]